MEEKQQSPWEEVYEPPPGYRTQSEDTSYAVERFLFERWRAMEPHEKAQQIDAMHAAGRELARIGARDRHPEASEHDLRMWALVAVLGEDLVARAYGWRGGNRAGR